VLKKSPSVQHRRKVWATRDSRNTGERRQECALNSFVMTLSGSQRGAKRATTGGGGGKDFENPARASCPGIKERGKKDREAVVLSSKSFPN